LTQKILDIIKDQNKIFGEIIDKKNKNEQQLINLNTSSLVHIKLILISIARDIKRKENNQGESLSISNKRK
jgi:hypothetical protein